MRIVNERKKKYVFIGNSSKPTISEYESEDKIILSNVAVPCVESAHKLGYEIIVGTNRKFASQIQCNYDYVSFYCSDTYRNPFNLVEVRRAYRQLDDLLKKGDVDVIHCNTPIGGLVGRLCGHKHNIRRVIYTAHGFHFYHGAPLLNNTILKWVERWLAKYTDAILTMNKEDFAAAKTFKLKHRGKAFIVNGVGINTNYYQDVVVDRKAKRKELNLSDEDTVIISMGDLVKRKNYRTALQAVADTGNKKIHYLICGIGEDKKNLEALAKKLDIVEQVHFLSYRKDVMELLKAADIFLLSSFQEGMPRSLMEAMSSGLPCIVSNIRGNLDLIKNEVNGLLCEPTNSDAFAKAIQRLVSNKHETELFIRNSLEVIKNYDTSMVTRQIEVIYKEILAE